MALRPQPRLDPRERHVAIPGPAASLELFLRHLPPEIPRADGPRVVLYVHGGTFASGLSIAHRFDGRSWRDDLCALGFDVWGFDFLGFGASDRFPEMGEPADRHGPLGQAEDASRQIERVVRWICGHHGVPRLSIVAHSWGTIAAGRFAAAFPELVDRMVFFGPVAWRRATGTAQRFPALRASRRFCRGGILMRGGKRTLVPIRRAARVTRRASRPPAGRGRTSPTHGMAAWLMIRGKSERRLPSFGGSGTVWRRMRMRAGCSTPCAGRGPAGT